MSDHAHAMLVFYGGILGLILLITCIWCITHYRRLFIREVVTLSRDDPAAYITISDDVSPLYNNKV
jgi:nitrate reductase gamma subunit